MMHSEKGGDKKYADHLASSYECAKSGYVHVEMSPPENGKYSVFILYGT